MLDKSEWNVRGAQAASGGDLLKARDCFLKAAHNEKRDPSALLNLAVVEEKLGNVAGAAAALTKALRIERKNTRAARRLSRITASYVLDQTKDLDPVGLINALRQDGLDRQPLVRIALQFLKDGGALASAFHLIREGDKEGAARMMLHRRTHTALKDPLLHAALSAGKNTDPEWEAFLGALRKLILCDLDDERFGDRGFWGFAYALLRQCINNEYVFVVEDAETAALQALAQDHAALAAEDDEQARILMKLSLYQPLETIPAALTPGGLKNLRPRLFQELAASHLAEIMTERALSERIETFGNIDDATSLKVAAQYESSPYPRWQTFAAPESGSARRLLERFAPAGSLNFMDADFDVLIAGAGTGQHALRSALAYGERAHVLAIDISRSSLAYASRKAAELGISNISFVRADILELDRFPRNFQIIECAGVLHHMADPLASGEILVERLVPGGMLFLGLYSAVSRRNLTSLRNDPAYPGPGCSDDAARAFRTELMRRPEGGAGTELLVSDDFYAMSDFRDLALHESEVHLTLPEIEEFLDKAGLAFRGFMLAPHQEAEFAAAFPDDRLPGTLANWWRLERDNPALFDAMYQFWCRKPD